MKFALTALCLSGSVACADGAITFTTDESFDDVTFGIESAIVGRGLVIDATSHIGAMLERTRADVGSDIVLFEQADVFSFCSASLSRKVMEADITNLRFCPYDIFVYTTAATPGETVVGFNEMPEGAMKEVEALLTDIVQEALGLE
ncbi:MAG: DUF302 domain-containing protein [Rhodobacteraceae bacterium]|nr:DUF302 domain-containing protein [Paracoccaceae bacterium]